MKVESISTNSAERAKFVKLAPGLGKGAAARFLAEIFARNGYIRVPNKRRRERENQSYKKGYEVRLRLNGEAELDRVRSCLELVGLTSAKPYAHGRQIVQSVHGKKAIQAFAVMVKQAGSKTPRLRSLESVS